MTLITSGEMLYRINHQEYHVKKGDALFCNANALHAGTMYHEQDCTYISVTFDSRLLSGFEGSLIHRKYVSLLRMTSPFPPSVLTAVHHGILLLLPLFSTLLYTMRKKRMPMNWQS